MLVALCSNFAKDAFGHDYTHDAQPCGEGTRIELVLQLALSFFRDSSHMLDVPDPTPWPVRGRMLLKILQRCALQGNERYFIGEPVLLCDDARHGAVDQRCAIGSSYNNLFAHGRLRGGDIRTRVCFRKEATTAGNYWGVRLQPSGFVHLPGQQLGVRGGSDDKSNV